MAFQTVPVRACLLASPGLRGGVGVDAAAGVQECAGDEWLRAPSWARQGAATWKVGQGSQGLAPDPPNA